MDIWELKKVSYFEYQEYLWSEEWQEKRRTIRELTDGICQICNEVRGSILHHKTYENLFDESPDDLVWVCLRCHTVEHLKGGFFVPDCAKKFNGEKEDYLS